MRLGNACRYGAHAAFGHKLHADAGIRVGVFEIEDQLRQILDGINIVMRRRRDKRHSRRRVPGFGDN